MNEDQTPSSLHSVSTGGGPGPDMRRGPGPGVMGTRTLLGNDVYNDEGKDLGDIKEIMLDMASGKSVTPCLPSVPSSVWGRNCSQCRGMR